MYKQLVTKVIDILFENEKIQKLRTDKGAERAILYKNISPSVKIGADVVVNVTATELVLGTGGWDIVREVISVRNWSQEEVQGHIMKLRYTPIQHSILAIESLCFIICLQTHEIWHLITTRLTPRSPHI